MLPPGGSVTLPYEKDVDCKRNDGLSSAITSVFSQQSIVHAEVFCYNKEKKIKMDVYML
jgi:hypothetical protein